MSTVDPEGQDEKSWLHTGKENDHWGATKSNVVLEVSRKTRYLCSELFGV